MKNLQLRAGRLVAGILGVLLSLFPIAFANADQSGQTFAHLRAEHQYILDELNTKGDKGGPVELDDDQVPALLKSGWNLAGQWAAAYLESHPAPTARELKTIFDGFAPKPKGVKSQYGDFFEYHTYCFEGSVTRIAPAVYVAQAHYWMDNDTGTFFVVAHDRNGRFRARWNIKDLAEKHYAQRDEIGRWVHLTRRAYYNGPLDVRKVLALSPAFNGHPRFLVDAFQSAHGGTALAQLSVWEWNGFEALPLLIKTYHYTWDDGTFRFDGKMLRIGTKEETQSFSSCGGCPEPRGIWTIRITPKDVQDLGHRFLQPEMEWADELLSKISAGADTAGLARPDVVSTIKRVMQEISSENQQPNESEKEDRFYWGMLNTFRSIKPGQHGVFELALDEARLRFTYVLRNGKPYFTKVRVDKVI
ncbi:MAG: hypothetical protein LAN37_05115 [Acidobacteriia bacterium]|nr:hypothetical protein [Terriglobia bacterium]